MGVARKTSMPPSGAEYHFAISLGIALLAGPAWAFFRRSASALPMAAASFITVMAVGLGKEIHDLLTNPWKMSPADLRADSASDMAWDLAGGLAGIAVLLVLLGLASVLARLSRRPASLPVEEFRREFRPRRS
jgi:hypothetical protein